MSRILLVGVGPLPSPEKRRLYAPGLKLEAFLKALRRAECEILLGEIYFPGIDDKFTALESDEIIEHRLLGQNRNSIAAELEDWIDKAQPDAVIGTTDIGCLSIARTSYKGPFLAAYFGSPMAERQQQASIHGSNASLHEAWLNVLPVLLRADQFIVESNAQRLALIGELGAAGRLNAETCGKEMIGIVRPSLPFEEPFQLTDPDFLKKHGVPENAHTILTTGGYNTWVDEETLFLGVEDALKKDENLHFVSTGGAIEGHVELVYTRFTERIEKSPVKDRFHLLGWVRHEDLFNAMLLADVAVNCDRWSLEGELGARNRILGWLWAGLPVVSTVTSDSVKDLVNEGFVRKVAFEDVEGLSTALREEAHASKNADTLKTKLHENWCAETSMQPVEKWAKAPRRAPDREEGGNVENPLADLQRSFLSHAQTNTAAEELADRLMGSRALRLYMKAHPEVRALIKRIKQKP